MLFKTSRFYTPENVKLLNQLVDVSRAMLFCKEQASSVIYLERSVKVATSNNGHYQAIKLAKEIEYCAHSCLSLIFYAKGISKAGMLSGHDGVKLEVTKHHAKVVLDSLQLALEIRKAEAFESHDWLHNRRKSEFSDKLNTIVDVIGESFFDPIHQGCMVDFMKMALMCFKKDQNEEDFKFIDGLEPKEGLNVNKFLFNKSFMSVVDKQFFEDMKRHFKSQTFCFDRDLIGVAQECLDCINHLEYSGFLYNCQHGAKALEKSADFLSDFFNRNDLLIADNRYDFLSLAMEIRVYALAIRTFDLQKAKTDLKMLAGQEWTQVAQP